MGGFLVGLGARTTALTVSVAAVLVVCRATAQSATPTSAAPPSVSPEVNAAATSSAPPAGSAPPLTSAPAGAEIPLSFLVAPVGGIGHGRKRKLISPEDYRPLWITVRIPSRSFVVLGDGDAEVANCADQCQFWAYTGTYHVRLANALGEDSKTLRLRVSKPGDYTLVLGDDGERDAGLVLGITGSAAFVIGGVVALLSASELGCDAATPCKTPQTVYYGLATMGAGAALGTVGFVLFGGNITRFHYEGLPAPVMTRVGAVPVPGGVGIGTAITF